MDLAIEKVMMGEWDEEQGLDRHSITDIKEFNVFFKDFFESVYGFALKYIDDHDVARDIAQETFIKVYERRANFDSKAKAKSFAYTTARNLSLDHLKHQKVQQHYAEYMEGAGEELFFLHEITYQETIRIVRAAIQQLSPQSRNIILLNLTGKNNVEIAEEMSISVNTVKTQKKRAYKLLREILGKHYLDLLVLYCMLERLDHWPLTK